MTFSLKQFLRKSMLSAMTVSLVAPAVAPLAFADEIVAPAPKTLSLTYGYGGNVNFEGSLDAYQEFTPGSEVTLTSNTWLTDDDGVEYNSNYLLYQVHVVTESGAVVTGKISEDRRSVTFKMPNENATVYPSFSDGPVEANEHSHIYNKNISYEINKDVSITLDKPMGYEIGDDVVLAVTKSKHYKFDSLSVTDEEGRSYQQNVEVKDDEHAIITVKDIKAPLKVEWLGHTIGEGATSTQHVDKNDATQIDKDLAPYDPRTHFTKDILDSSKVSNISDKPTPYGFFTIKKTYFDASKLQEDDTLASIYRREAQEREDAGAKAEEEGDNLLTAKKHSFSMLGQDESMIALYEVDSSSDYLVGHIPGVNHKETFETTFAENNYHGVVLEDVVYDEENHIVYVPRKYYTEEFMIREKEAMFSPVQVQFAQKVESAKSSKDVTVTVDKIFNSDKIAATHVDTIAGVQKVTVSLGDQSFLSNLTNKDFTIYDNGIPVTQSQIVYNNDTHILEISGSVSTSGQLDIYISKDKNFLLGMVSTRGEKRAKEAKADVPQEELEEFLYNDPTRAKSSHSESLSNISNWDYTTEVFSLHFNHKPDNDEGFTFRAEMGNTPEADRYSLPNQTSVADSVSGANAYALAQWVVNYEGYPPSSVVAWDRGSAPQLGGGAYSPVRWIKISGQSSNTNSNGTSFSFRGSEHWLLLSCAHVAISDTSGSGLDEGWRGWNSGHYDNVDARIYSFTDYGNGTGWAVLGVYSPKFADQSGIGYLTVKVTYNQSSSGSTGTTPQPRPRPNPRPDDNYTPPPISPRPQPRPQPSPSPSTKNVYFKIRKTFKNAQSMPGAKNAMIQYSLDGTQQRGSFYATLNEGSTYDTVESQVYMVTMPAYYESATLTISEDYASSGYYTATPQYNRIFPPQSGREGEIGTRSNPFVYTLVNTPKELPKKNVTVIKEWQNPDGSRMSDAEARNYTATIRIDGKGSAYTSSMNVTAQGHLNQVVQLAPGEYDVTETYDTAKFTQYAHTDSFIVRESTNGLEVIFKNRLRPQFGKIRIAKRWVNTHNVSGEKVATFTITGPNNYSKTVSITNDNAIEVDSLPPGAYIVSESTTNDKYTVEPNKTVNVAVNQTASVEFVNNSKPQVGKIRISKSWRNTHNVSGEKVATFTITGPNNYRKSVSITGDNSTEIEGLAPGAYSVSEATPNANYTTESAKNVTVAVNQTANVAFVNNSKPQNGKIRISKRWVNKDQVSGDKVATFTVTGPNNYRKTVSITGDASTEINDVPKGQYSISEATSNTNYTVEAAKQVTVTPEQTASVEFVNNPKDIGSLKLRKLSSNPILTNSDQYAKYYSLNGAVFTLTYLDDPSRTWTLTTNTVTTPPGRGQRERSEHGIATLNNLPLGRYKLVETTAPRGFTLNSTPKEFTLNNNTLQTIDFTNSPQPVDDLEPRIRTTATDSFTNSHQGSFGNKLSITDRVEYSGLTPNTEYEVVGTLMSKSNSKPLLVNGQPLTVTKRFTTTDKVGIVNVTFETPMTDEVRQQLENDSVVVYEDLYEDLATNRHILVGHRNIDDEAQTVKYGKVVTTAKAKSSGGHVSSSPETTISDLVEYKNLIPGQKYKVVATVMSKETGQRLSNSPSLQVSKVFTPTSPNGSVTVEISNVPIEPGKSAVIFETIYFGDTTTVVGRHEDINDEAQTLHTPKVETTAKDKLTDSHNAPASGNRVITDTVEMKNLVPGQVYTLEGKFVDKTNTSVAIATATKQFTATEVNMSETLEFTIDTSKYAGKDLVAFEYLKVNSTWTATPTPTVVAKHEDPSSKSQTVTVGQAPRLGTSATDRTTGDHVGTLYNQNLEINDVVSYSGLEVGKKYVLHGKLMRKSDNTMLSGTQVVTKEFTPTAANGTVTVTFSVLMTDSLRTTLAGDALVVFEKLTTAADANKVIASHEDIHSSDQTVTYPYVSTNAASNATGEHSTSNEVDSITDVVTYENVVPNKEYKIVATLMDKVRNAPILKNNKPITVEKTFTPTDVHGQISVTFENVTLTPGSTAVVFEKLYLGTTLVGKHEDINDLDQSVHRARVRTTAKEKNTNAKSIEASGRKTLVDVVSYENLVPGKEYVIEGSFVRKNDSNRTPIATARKVFTPSLPNGEVTLEFTVDASKYPNEDLVAFETLKVKKLNSTDYVEVASHKDPNDASQTVRVKPKRTDLPATGTLGILVTVIVAAGLIGSVAYLQYKKRK
jgi:collagen adhesion protein